MDLVTGKTIETDCYAMRHRWVECGPDAKLFDPENSPKRREDKGGGSSPSETGHEYRIDSVPGPIGHPCDIGCSRFTAVPTRDASTPRHPNRRSLGEEVSVKDGSCCVTARTQLLATGKRSLWQFEASPGVWEDCGDDCQEALRRKLDK